MRLKPQEGIARRVGKNCGNRCVAGTVHRADITAARDRTLDASRRPPCVRGTLVAPVTEQRLLAEAVDVQLFLLKERYK
jgi:hypothetical protein